MPQVGGSRVDSFNLRGPVTRRKHMHLREYLTLGQGRFDDYLVLSALRHPLDRMLSLYFWPGRWVRSRVPLGQTASMRVTSPRAQRILTKQLQPQWDEEQFLALVARSSTHCDYLRLPNGSVRKPDWLLDHRDPDSSLRELASLIGVDALGPLPRRNVGKPDAVRTSLRTSKHLAEAVQRAHQEDYEVFGFPVIPG
jgi:hypothetical protein